MNDNLFKVIYQGSLKEGFDEGLVVQKFADKFNVNHQKALSIIQAGKDITLNKKMAHVKAYHLKTTLEEMGLNIRLERFVMDVEKTEATKQQDNSESQTSPNDTERSSDVEPKQIETPAWQMESIEHNQQQSNETDSKTSVIEPQQKPVDHGKVEVEYSSNNLSDKLKTIGGWVLGIGGGLFILLKKFGLLKLLKIGVVFAAASAIGFDPEQACMDNSQCESDVDDQMDACWEDNGFEDIDWDNISAEEYIALKPKIENDFIGCFIYLESGERIFNSPIDLRFELMDFCDAGEIKNCNELIEPQIKGCYISAGLDKYFDENTTDYYSVYYEHPEAINDFYQCFEDENGNSILEDYYGEGS